MRLRGKGIAALLLALVTDGGLSPLPAYAGRSDLVLYDGSNAFFTTTSHVDQNTLDPERGTVCYLEADGSGGTVETSPNRGLGGYKEMAFEARVDDLGSATPPTVMISLSYDDGSGAHKTLMLDITPFAAGNLFDGQWHPVRIPLKVFRTDASRWAYVVRKISFAQPGTGTTLGSGYPAPNGAPYHLWFDDIRFIAEAGPVAAEAHVVVDRDLVGLVFPDAVDRTGILGREIRVERDTGGGYQQVPVVRRGYWALPHLHDNGYTRTRYTFYVQLAEHLVPGARYRFTYYRGTHEMVFDPLAEVCPGIKVNQEGYSPDATTRYAYLGYYAGDGNWVGDGTTVGTVDYGDNGDVEVRLEADDSLVTTITPVARGDEYNEFTGERVMDLDISGLAAGDTYYILLPGVGRSYPFGIDHTRTFGCFYATARGLFHQRWNQEKADTYSSWPRPADHAVVYTSDKTSYTMHDPATPQTGARVVHGGHHDAGDFDLRPAHAQIASTLMSLVEHFPAKFADGQLDIPESGNGLPDLLDEGIYQLQAWRDLQEADGGVRFAVESSQHPDGPTFADEDTLVYWTYARSASFSAYVAGLFAQASRLLDQYGDGTRAADYLARAWNAYNYARGNGASSGKLMMAECHLFKTTGDAAVLARLESRFGHIANPDDTQPDYIPFNQVWPYNGLLAMSCYQDNNNLFEAAPLLAYVTAPQAGKKPDLVDDVKGEVVMYGAAARDFAFHTTDPSSVRFRPYRSCARDNIIEWWGAGTTPGRVLNAIWGYVLTSDARMRDAISLTADSMLGCNPRGKCWITGLGVDNPQQLLDLDSRAWTERFGWDQVAGIPTYGICPSPGGLDYIREVIDKHWPPYDHSPPPDGDGLPQERRYCDAWPLVPSAEFSVCESCQPAVATFAVLLPDTAALPTQALRDYHVNRTPPENEGVGSNDAPEPEPYSAISYWYADFIQAPSAFPALIAIWHFDEGNGGSASGASSSNWDITIHDPAIWSADPEWTDPPSGHCLTMTGGTDVAASLTTPAIDPGNGYTIGSWIRVDRKDGSQQVVGIGNLFSIIKEPYSTGTGGRLKVTVLGSAAYCNADLNQWYHVLAVYDPAGGINGKPAGAAGETRIYINQVSQPEPLAFGLDNQARLARFNVNTAPTAGSRNLAIGRDYWHGDVFPGAVDELVLYAGALDRRDYLAGQVAYTGYQVGVLSVIAATNAGTRTDGRSGKLDNSGSYVIPGVQAGVSYWIKGWLDMNGDDTPDSWEPYGEYAGNPVQFPAFGDAAGSVHAWRALDFVLADADVDGDGISDAQELSYWGNLAIADARTDFDGDGSRDRIECRAGTDPLDRASRYTLAIAAGIHAFVLRWPSSFDRSYRVESSSDLLHFHPVVTGIAPTPPENALTFPIITSPEYWRVGVE